VGSIPSANKTSILTKLTFADKKNYWLFQKWDFVAHKQQK